MSATEIDNFFDNMMLLVAIGILTVIYEVGARLWIAHRSKKANYKDHVHRNGEPYEGT